jgi:hypothetical protein
MTDKHKIDFDGLFEFWICTGLHIYDFAVGLGIDKDAGIISVLRNWPAVLKEKINNDPDALEIWKKTSLAKKTDAVSPGDLQLEPFKRKLRPALEKAVKYEIDFSSMSTEEIRETITQKIIRWREKQAISDWNLAENLRRYIKTMITETVKLDVDNRFFWSASSIRQIAAAMVDLQKMQRLALGMSSENIGIPLKGVNQGGEQIPVVNFNAKD